MSSFKKTIKSIGKKTRKALTRHRDDAQQQQQQQQSTTTSREDMGDHSDASTSVTSSTLRKPPSDERCYAPDGSGTLLNTLSAAEMLLFASKSGYCQKSGSSVKSWRKRFFVLVGPHLFYFKDEHSSEALGHITMDGTGGVMRADAEVGREYAFKCVTRGRVLFCAAESEFVAEQWIHALRMAGRASPAASADIAGATLTGWMSEWCSSSGSRDDDDDDDDDDDGGYGDRNSSGGGGGVWRDRFCAISRGRLLLYRSDTDTHRGPLRILPLAGCVVKRCDADFANIGSSGGGNDDGIDDEDDSECLRECLRLTVHSSSGSGSDRSGTSAVTLVLSSEDDDIEIWRETLEREADDSGSMQDKSSFKGWLEMDVSGGSGGTVHTNKLAWRRKYLVLQGQDLVVFEDDRSKRADGRVPLTGRIVTRCDEETQVPFTFKISTGEESVVLRAQGEDEADCWIEFLKTICKSQKVQEFQKSGWLTKQGGSIKTWKKRFCVLRGSRLYYYKNPGDTEPKGSIELAGQMVRHLAPREGRAEVDRDNVIKVFTLTRTWYLFADKEQDIIEWAIVMRKAALLFRGRTLYVNPMGSKKKSDTFTTITQALAKARDMDRIIISEGVYKESLYIKKALILEGEGDVRIENKNSAPIVFATSACKLNNITVKQNGPTIDANCINIERGNVFLAHCDISSSGGNCINVAGEGQITLTNCKVHKAKMYGVWMSAKASGLFENNIIFENGWDGVMLMGESDLIMRGTKVSQNSYNGLAISSSGRVTIEYCEISKNKWDGVAVSNVDASTRISDNRIVDNDGYGLYFAHKGKNTHVDNELTGNKKGQVSEPS